MQIVCDVTTPPPTPEDARPGRWTPAQWLGALLLVAATLLTYHRVWHADYIWDDDAHVTPPVLRTFHGLARIWFQPGATQQYYPVLYSAFWAEHRLWGDAATGYHLATILLHAAAACLLYRLLTRLAVPGALLGAALFALHPVNVESVAWISEQKNTLSAVFYFAAALAYLDFDRGRRWGPYGLGTILFTLALLSKSVTAVLPAALLVVLWWKRGRLALKGDVPPLAPWFGLGAASGTFTAWMERTHVGAHGAAFHLSVADRVLVAGRALWFYLGKDLWPSGLTFIYPRWAIDSGSAAQYVFPAAAAAVLACCWAARRTSRSPLAAGLLFAGTLFPALGFVDVFPFLYSFVADHFQYLASAVIAAAVAANATMAIGLLSPGARHAPRAACWAVVALLASIAWRQSGQYADVQTLWRATIARNPECWMAYNNLAAEMLSAGRTQDAIDDAVAALRLAPDDAAAHATLGEAFSASGRTRDAFGEFNRALELEPNNAAARINFGALLLAAGRTKDAKAQYQTALEVVPDSATAHSGLGGVYMRENNIPAAIGELRLALEDGRPEASTHANLGTALMMMGRANEGIVEYRAAIALDPKLLVAQFNLGNALQQRGETTAAIEQFRRAIEVAPNFAQAHYSLGALLLGAGQLDEAIQQLTRAVQLAPSYARARQLLSQAEARAHSAQ